MPEQTIVITSGRKYLDIDAYASMIAYRKLLQTLQPEWEVRAISSARLNQSIPKSLRNLDYQLDSPTPTSTTGYIVLDVSNPDFIDPLVDDARIIELIDHHPGYDAYWRSRLGAKSQIEPIGSVCTIIFEKYLDAGKESLLDQPLCKLLSAGILDNTLNLKAKITSARDSHAYELLLKLGKLDQSWSQTYFQACDQEILRDLKTSVLDDLKIESVSPFLPQAVGQLVLSSITAISFEDLAQIFAEQKLERWLINIIALDEGKSYLYFDGEGVREGLEQLFGVASKTENSLILDRPWLRKEIFQLALYEL